MQEIKLNIVPGGVIPVLHATQYDVGRELKFLIFDGNSPASLTGTTATIEGTKPDGNGFSYECTISNNEVTVETTAQMTVLSGSIDCKITFFKESDRIGTALFILDIEKAALNSDTPISDTDIPTIIALAREQEQNAEAWANGTRGGEPTTPTDPTYHKDARYWAEYAEEAVQGVSGVKGNAENEYRRGNVNLTPANIGALATDGDSKDNTVTFTSSDNDTTTEKTSDGFTSVATMASGESHASLFQKISKMFLNIRKLWNTVGSTAIPSELGTTVTGALSNIDASNHYSTSETWTGKYDEDGNKIYQKIFNKNMAAGSFVVLDNSLTKTTIKILKVELYPSSYYFSSADYNETYVGFDGNNKLAAKQNNAWSATVQTRITVYYIKTT